MRQRVRLSGQEPPETGLSIGRRRRLSAGGLVVLVSLLALTAFGCTIEGGGMGRLVIDIRHIPDDVFELSYVAESSSGFGHYKSRPITFRGDTAVADLGDVAVGVWRIEVLGKDASRETVFEHKRTVSVRNHEHVIVKIWDWEFVEASEHGLFIGHNVSGKPLQQYIDVFEQFIVPGLLESTGLHPSGRGLDGSDDGGAEGDGRPFIHLYGTEHSWRELSPCVGATSCYDPVLRDIHVNASESDGLNEKALTETYVHWLAVHEGRIRLPYWFSVGLARNEAERVYLGDDEWNNPWLDGQWDEIRRSATLVPDLARHSRADAFTFTAVSRLLQTGGGRRALHEFFRLTRSGLDFEHAFRDAFGMTTAEYQTVYEDAVERERGDGPRR